MEDFVFENSTKAYFGKKAVSRYLPDLLKQYGPNVMLAYGGGSIKRNGIYDEVMAILKAAGKTVTEFAGIMSNPTYAKVLEGAAAARKCHADLILAVGGGSVFDCCKAIALAAVYDGDVWADFWAKAGTIDFPTVPLGIILTVSGTGSEMNGGAVITNEDLKVKTGRDYPALNAKFAILDPLYTLSVPHKQFVSGAFDSLSHMMEIYFSAPDTDNVSDSMNEALMKSVVRNLRAALRNPEDYNARSNLVWLSISWNTPWAPTRTATTAAACPCCIRSITATSIRTGPPSSPASQPGCGISRQQGRAKKNWPRKAWKPWRPSSRKSACRRPCGSWACRTKAC